MANMIGTIGADVLFATTASDSITGGGGNDFIIGVPAAGIGASSIAYGSNTIVTGAGNATIVAGANSTITTGQGNAAVILGFADAVTGNETLNLGVGNNVVLSVSGNNTINGGGLGAIDLIVAGSGRDVVLAKTNELIVVQAGAGNQMIDASKAFASILIGGSGNATMLGGASSNTITAGTGADSLSGGSGNDQITVTSLTRFAAGGGGNDTLLLAGTGATLTSIDLNLLANQNATTTLGVAFGPVLQGFRNVDASASAIGVAITGDNNGDRLIGSRGASTITGGTGNDFILGGAANDVISISRTGFAGDTVSGGAGTNTLLLNGGLANATISAANLAGYSNIQTLAIGAIGTGNSIVLTDALVRQLSGGTSLRFDLASATNSSGGALGGGQIALDLTGVTAASSLSFIDPNGLIGGFRVTNPNGVALPIVAVTPVIATIPVPGPGPLLSAATGLTAAQALTIVNPVNSTGSTISTSGLAATVTMYNPAGTASIANLLINGVPTLNVVSNTLLPDTLSFSASTTGLSTLNLTGVAPITVTPGVTAAQLDAINASGLGPLANLTLTAGLTKTGAVVTGSNSGDSYTGATVAAGIVRYNGGTGNDLMKMTSAQIQGSNGIGNAFDGGGGTNTLEVTDLGGVQVSLTDVAGQFTNLQRVQSILVDSNFGLTLTTGANFNTNFAVGGVAITAANLGAVGPTQSTVINLGDTANAGLNKFTGAATVAVTTHVTTGNTSIVGGSGTNVIAVTTDLMTTGIVKIIGGNGADTISVTSVAPGQANTGGATADFVINPGAGADRINLLVQPSTLFAGNYVNIDIGSVANSPLTAFKVVSGIFVSNGTLRLPDEITFGNAPSLPSTAGPVALPGTFQGAALTYSITNTGTTNGKLTFAGTTAAQLQPTDVINYYSTNIAPTLGANKAIFWDDVAHNHDSYVFDHAGAGSDALIQLVGGNVQSLTATTTQTTPGFLVIL